MIVFISPFIYAADSQMYVECGGDDQLVVLCDLGTDSQASIFGYNIQEEEGSSSKVSERGMNKFIHDLFIPFSYKTIIVIFLAFLLLVLLSYFIIKIKHNNNNI